MKTALTAILLRTVAHAAAVLSRLLLALGFASALHANALTNALNLIELKQGISILCPADLHIWDSNNVEKIEDFAKSLVSKARPTLKYVPNRSGKVLMIAADNRDKPKQQFQLTAGSPELSQAQITAFTPKQIQILQKMMLDQLEGALPQFGITVTKRLDSQVLKGKYLYYFSLGYEYSDSTKVPKIAVRSYYYTKSGTFILSFTCDKDYFTRNIHSVETILGALNTVEE
jgi:hypothetical protein